MLNKTTRSISEEFSISEFAVYLGLSSLLWCFFILIAPLNPAWFNVESIKNLGFFNAWLNDFRLLVWILGVGCLLTSMGFFLQKSLTQAQSILLLIVLWFFLGLILLPLAIFTEAITVANLILISSISIVSAYFLSRLIKKINFNISIQILLKIFILLPMLLLILPIDVSGHLQQNYSDNSLGAGEKMYFFLKHAVFWVPPSFIVSFVLGPLNTWRWFRAFYTSFWLISFPLIWEANMLGLFIILSMLAGSWAGQYFSQYCGAKADYA